MQPGISIITHGPSLAEIAKDYLRRLGFGQSRGPLAVESNLIKGLEKIGASYNLNPHKASLFPNLSVLRSVAGVMWLVKQKKSNLIVGPNFSASDLVYLQKAGAPIKFFLAPSKEVKFTFIHYGILAEKIKIWPVGIDTEDFTDVSKTSKTCDALIYFKRRTKKELEQAIGLLKQQRQTYTVLEYGYYSKNDFKQVLSQSRYAVILDGNESQGIALEAIMASNLPLFVFDQIYIGETSDLSLAENLQSTSVPYWSKLCGMKVPTDTYGKSKNSYFSISECQTQFEQFLNQLPSFKPREFILENLSLEKQAKEFTALFI